MSELSVSKYVELVGKSQLVTSSRLQSAYEEFVKSADHADAEQLAEHFEQLGLVTEWHNQKLLQGKYKGFILGKYKFLKKIGAGGMGAVYMAQHIVMDRLAAIKVLPKARVDRKSYLERFQLEARALAQLNHKNIVQVYDVDNHGDLHYIVMEFVEGIDLEQLVKADGPLTDVRAANYIGQAVRGLHHAHHRKLIHRDIKPSNLLLDKKVDNIKLLDLGLARITDDDESLTQAYDEKMLGTADYLSPEQAVNSHNVDPRTDVYSLGCTLYFLLTGHPPFYKGTVAKRLMQHQKEEPESIADIRKQKKLPAVNEGLIRICQKMMAKAPENRYQSAKDIYAAICEWAEAQKKARKTKEENSLASLSSIDSGAMPDRLETPDPSEAIEMPSSIETTSQLASDVSDESMASEDTDASQMAMETIVNPTPAETQDGESESAVSDSAITDSDSDATTSGVGDSDANSHIESSSNISNVWSQSSIYSNSGIGLPDRIEHEPPSKVMAESPLIAQLQPRRGIPAWVWSAVATGLAFILVGILWTVFAGGFSNSNAPDPPDNPVQPSIAVADELLVNLDANDTDPSKKVWPNKGTLGGVFEVKQRSEFTIHQDHPTNAVSIALDQYYLSGPEAPERICGANSRTIEVWVYNPEAGAREPMVAWGKSGNESASGIALLFGTDPNQGGFDHETNTSGWTRDPSSTGPAAGMWNYLVYTYEWNELDLSKSQSRLFINGIETNSGQSELSTATGSNILLGAMPELQEDRASLNLAIVRIHAGALSGRQIVQNYKTQAARFGHTLP